MPTTNNRFLTLTENDDDVTVNVTYNAVFSSFERSLSTIGVFFQERITVNGVDANAPDKILHIFQSENLPVTAGQGPQTIARNRSMTVSRKSLDEDFKTIDLIGSPSNPIRIVMFHEDEIRCRIEIVSMGLPSATGLTDQKILLPHETEEEL